LAEITEVLMQNARVHGAGAVSVTVRHVGHALALEVSDRGPGFGPDPDGAFARGAGEGHGIGLALARSLAHAEGARLQITHAGPAPTVSLLMPHPPDVTKDEDPAPHSL
jgi:signal transduction histidine kinase